MPHGLRGTRSATGLIAGALGVLMAVGLLGPGARAEEKSGTFQTEGVEFTVKYYAGGVGSSPQREAVERSPDYSVRVLFAAPDRSLLANVGLVVTDAKGRVVFRIERADPVIYLGLPKGLYAFEGSYHGSVRRHPGVAVDPASRPEIVFVFPE
jgi:hypothetical protein